MIVLNEKLERIDDTAQAKFVAGLVFVLYDGGDIVMELWNASTKHPDIAFSYDDFYASDFMDDNDNIVAWIAYCATKVYFRSTMYRILKLATKKTGKTLYKQLLKESAIYQVESR